MSVISRALHIRFDLLLTLQACHFWKRTWSNQGNEPQMPIPCSMGWATEFTPFIFNILFLGFVLSILEDVRLKVLLSHRMRDRLERWVPNGFALLSTALTLNHMPCTLLVQGLCNPHMTRGEGCLYIKIEEQTQSTAWHTDPLAFFHLSHSNQVLCLSQEGKKDGP